MSQTLRTSSRFSFLKRTGVGLPIIALIALLIVGSLANAAEAPVGLGTAGNFAVLAGSAITNVGATTITGDVGLHPGTSVTGFDTVILSGELHVADAVAEQAKVDLGLAYTDAAGRGPPTQVPTELGGQTLLAGVYNSASGTFGITGTVTLDGANNPDSVFIFQMTSTLVTATGSNVELINGADPCNVFWQVGSSATIEAAELGAISSFKGTVLAQESITLNTGARVEGRMLAITGAVTMGFNAITNSGCPTLPPAGGATSTPSGPSPTPTATPTGPSPSPSATPTGPSPTPTATPTGPSPSPSATPTGPSPSPTPTGPSPTPTGPNPSPSATATGPSPTPTSTSTGPGQNGTPTSSVTPQLAVTPRPTATVLGGRELPPTGINGPLWLLALGLSLGSAVLGLALLTVAGRRRPITERSKLS